MSAASRRCDMCVCTEHSESVTGERVSALGPQTYRSRSAMSTQNHSSPYTLVTIVKRYAIRPFSRKQHTHAAGCRLEAVASRFEDLEDARRETRRQSTSTVTSSADAQPTAAPPPPRAPPAIVVQPVTPPSVQAFDAIVIEARLKPLVELTTAFAPQVLVDQVCFSHSKIYHYVLCDVSDRWTCSRKRFKCCATY